jgi:alkylhydroperoxidase family enzyme
MIRTLIVSKENSMAGGVLDRATVRVLEAGCRRMWGFAPRMIPHIVARMGALGALGWFAGNMPRYLVSMKVLGHQRTHLAGMVISLYNGCLYCAYAHGHALELLYLRDRDRLFPLDARTLEGWLGLPPRVLADRTQEVLREAGMQSEALWVDTTLSLLRGDQQPVDGAELRLAHLVRMFGTMNRIAVEAGCTEPDQAQNPVNKDRAVKERNAALRAARV